MTRLKIPLLINGRGMVTSLGYDTRTCCAAARSGLDRPGPIESHLVISADDGEAEPVTGHPATLLTHGFEGTTRLTRLLNGGLKDLLSDKNIASKVWCDARFYLSLPNRRERQADSGIDTEVKKSKKLKPNIHKAIASSADYKMGEMILRHGARLANWPCTPELKFVSVSGYTGVAEALIQAANDLESGEVKVAIVGGIDTLLEENTLYWLANSGRLNTPMHPSGLIPGEGCALLLLSTHHNGSHAALQHFGTIKDISLTNDPWTGSTDEPLLGIGLKNAIMNVLHSNQMDGRRPLWIITDQNGESLRAMEWGNSIVRLRAQLPDIDDPTLWYPAISFGDTCAVTGGIAICVATCAFDRKYAPCQNTIIVQTSDESLRSAILVDAPENHNSRS